MTDNRSYDAEYRDKNRERIRAYQRAWYAENKARQSAKRKRWYQANLEAQRARGRATFHRLLSDPTVRAKVNERRRLQGRQLKQQVLNVYGGFCACCGESTLEFLAIDHINGGGNQHRKAIKVSSGVSFYAWLKKQGYPKGYRVLCHNCNAARGMYGHCPHETRVRQILRVV